MVYYTGDIHGKPQSILEFCQRVHISAEDTIAILGDVGANYYADIRDQAVKRVLNRLGPAILCVHGNHEIRPANLPSYKRKLWNGGMVWYESEYPNLLFAKDGEIFTLDGLRHLVIGGAYSVDKFYRIARGWSWWPDEQPSEEIKRYVERQVATQSIDIILSHTCPFKYEPVEAFLPSVNQDTVDDSTERWLDTIEESAHYDAWLCGHWHIDKRIDRLHFLFHRFLCSEDIKRELPT